MNQKSYKNYQAAFTGIKALKTPLFVLKGDSEFLLLVSRRMLKDAWTAAGWECESVDGPQLNAERFLQYTSARSLFEPKNLTLVSNAFQNNDLLECLKGLNSTRDIQNPIGLIHAGEIPAKFQKEISRLAAPILPCDKPAPWELKDVLQDRCKAWGLRLDTDAIDLLLDAVGLDLFKLDNELQRISLCLPVLDKATTKQDLKPLLGFVREDHAFLISQYLCQDAYEKALLLIKDLLDRGESALAVLALLARHCRSALQIQSGIRNGISPLDLGRELHLPRNAVQSYVSYVGRRPANTFLKALNLCHEADRKLKSKGYGEEIYLNHIVWELMPHKA